MLVGANEVAHGDNDGMKKAFLGFVVDLESRTLLQGILTHVYV